MTSKRIITALTAVALSSMLLAGCTTTATPTPGPSTASATPTPTTGTKVPPPADEEEAIAEAKRTASAWLEAWATIESTGEGDSSSLDQLATARALQISANSIEHIRKGPIPDQNGEPVEGAGTVTGQITFEPQTAYGQPWEEVENGLVIMEGCQDISKRVVTTHAGTPAQRNESLRNMVEYKVIYDAGQQIWLVQDVIDLQRTC